MNFLRLKRKSYTMFVNMDLVSSIQANGGDGSVLYFVTHRPDGDQLYTIVDENLEEIATRVGAV